MSRSGFIVSTTPTMAGYKIVKYIGVVTGLSPRTRGVGGQIVGGLESFFGGEVTAFTSEIQKAREEAVARAIDQALAMGANAIIGMDMETSNLYQTVTLISATGTAVVVEQEK